MTPSRQLQTRTIVFACTAALFMLTGCGLLSGQKGPIVESSSLYDGPPASLEVMHGRHIAVFTMPSGGWSASFEYSERAYRQMHVFIDLREPDPSLSVTSALVEHRIDTTIDHDEAFTVFARVIPYGSDPALSAYRPAVSAQGAR